jgi:hypothetical protein
VRASNRDAAVILLLFHSHRGTLFLVGLTLFLLNDWKTI